MQILYFTSTGNCLAAAKRIGKEGNAELLSIPQLQKEGRYEISDEEAVGIVFPVYGTTANCYYGPPQPTQDYWLAGA